MRVIVGRIGRPHGIRGEVTIEPRTDEPEIRFAPGAVLYLVPPSVKGSPAATGPSRTLTVEYMHWHSGRLLVAFEEIADRNQAEDCRNHLLEIERPADEQPEDPDEYYDSALVGCAVRTAEGEPVGVIHDVLHLPAQELLAVRADDGREFLIPFVAAIVPTVDIAARLVTITPPPGLIEPLDEALREEEPAGGERESSP